ncbi:MAG: hypothetical protein OXN81_00850 [Alphaproteobacteria bacterium]|nr:hypothetical protein [Alphaproteobacteria bacterium]
MDERSSLFVEGADDLHALSHLLRRRGVTDGTPGFPKIEHKDGWQGVLQTIEIRIRFGTERRLGFVLDADGAPEDRWRRIERALQNTGLNPPETLPAEGYVDFCEPFGTHVGVWLMPDNRRRGAIEEFLLDLVRPNDPLLEHAARATAQASTIGATFPETARRKAELRAWLAWQESPGLPYGSAMAADYLDSGHPAAIPFVDWFSRLFGLDAG